MPRLSKIGAAALAAFGWTGLSTVSASYLVVAGGGSGGAESIRGAGGGGAGGLLTGTTSLNPLLSYTVTSGAGGASVSSASLNTGGNSGTNSQFGTLTAAVGGGGGGIGPSGTAPTNGKNGGSGGGAGADGSGASTAGTGTSGQGNNGGNGFVSASTAAAGGGGGGSSAVGSNASSSTGGAGGAGTASSISGTSVTYAGGGGGGSSGGGTGGSGGGGTGGTTGSAGTTNTGSGGGGIQGSTSGSGGSGVVIISYLSPQKFGGGIVTTSGSNTIHTFQTSGTLSPLSTLSASYLIVAGGGSGGGGGDANGGGGAGGLLTGSGLTIDTNSIYVVTVGAGGSITSSGSSSQFSAFATTAVGGGAGANRNSTVAASGGSGGGGSEGTTPYPTAGAGTSGQGFAGGNGDSNEGGGGGGAGAVGGNAVSNSTAGNGGVGLTSSISGTSTYYAGGGGGGNNFTSTVASGGLGGGGRGAVYVPNSSAVAGTANTGGGGGGNASGAGSAGAGGSGIVIISYAGSTQQMAGGTVTISGGNVIHTFTSSGYLTPLKLVNNSLRFRSSASANLTRQPTVTGSQTTATYSFWLKRGSFGAQRPFHTTKISSAGTNATVLQYNASDQLNLTFASTGGTNYSSNSNAVYRDPAAWYHVVVAVDTTQASSANRLRAYVNGVEITSWASSSIPPQSTNLTLSLNTLPMNIGTDPRDGTYYDGYLTEINFVDGQQLTPNSFGTFNSYGVWQPITYGGSYGTNGFYLPFTASQSYAGSFSGSSQWISVPNLAAYSVGTSNYTVEGWFYFNSLPASQGLFGCDNGSGSTPKFCGLAYSNGSIGLEFTNSGGSTFLTSSTGVVTTGKWYHIAWVRNSGTSTIYVNGTSVGSTSTSINLAGLTQAWNIGYIGESGPSSLAGYASNFRLVTGTAVYTANFVPQTTALKAISGTQILTLQNATLVDNSTNAQTVTNTGGVTVGGNYPFAIIGGTVKDQGPAGNNWTANNIGLINGSTLDTMTDVPTLTSTSTSNTCVWNPLASSSYTTLSNGNMTSAGNTATDNGITTSTFGITSGKWYWEITATTIYTGYGRYGIINAGQVGNGNVAGLSGIGAGYWASGQVYKNGSSLTTGLTFTNGDVIGFAFDADNLTIAFYKNNTLQYTVTGLTAGVTYFASSADWNTSVSNVNFGQQPFVYTPPTGFVRLNTYNL